MVAAPSSIDQALNFGIPAILILVVLGFVWTKMLEPWVMPMLVKLWGWAKDQMTKDKGEDGTVTRGRDIVYE